MIRELKELGVNMISNIWYGIVLNSSLKESQLTNYQSIWCALHYATERHSKKKAKLATPKLTVPLEKARHAKQSCTVKKRK